MARSDFKFFHTMRVRYSEIDHQGVVFNGHYLTYFDVGHTEYMRAAGYLYADEVAKTGIDFHLAKVTVEYKAPIKFDQEMDICVRTSRFGRTSMSILFEIYNSGTDDLLASGENINVCVKLSDHKPVPIPEKFIRSIEAFEGDSISNG